MCHKMRPRSMATLSFTTPCTPCHVQPTAKPHGWHHGTYMYSLHVRGRAVALLVLPLA